MNFIVTEQENKAILIAKYFIWKNKTTPKPTGLGKLKLQKLIYYAQAWNLVVNNKKLFEDEIEAWVHGPAIPIVFRYFKKYNFSDLKKNKIDRMDFAKFLSPKEKDLLDNIWEVYGKYDGAYLENLTHSELPWQKARGNMDELQPSQNIISTEDMKDFYGKRLKEANEEIGR